MKTLNQPIRTALKMTAVYAFALSTAVACGKFKGNTVIKATANGTGTVVREGTPGPVTNTNITIDRVQTVFLGEDEFSPFAWSLKMDVTHGGRALVFETYPSVNPFNEDGVQKNFGSINYVAKGVCGVESCSKFAVMLNVTDSSNGASHQRVQYWDLLLSNVAPQKTYTDSDFTSVTEAYEAASGQQLPNN